MSCEAYTVILVLVEVEMKVTDLHVPLALTYGIHIRHFYIIQLKKYMCSIVH